MEDVEWRKFLVLIGRIITLYILKTKEQRETSQPRIGSAPAASYEDILAAEQAALEAQRIANLPFSSGDSDENKAPLVSSETPVASADRTGLRSIIFEPTQIDTDFCACGAI